MSAGIVFNFENLVCDNRKTAENTGSFVPYSDTSQFRAGLVDEIARTMQTLRQDPVPHPGEAFYLERLEAYVQALADLDRTGAR